MLENIERNMTNTLLKGFPIKEGERTETISKRRERRYAAEKRFKILGILSILVAISTLFLLIGNMINKGFSAFKQTYLELSISLPENKFPNEKQISPNVISELNFKSFLKRALLKKFPEIKSRRDKRLLYKLISSGATFDLQDAVFENPKLLGKTITTLAIASDDVDQYIKGNITANNQGRITIKQSKWIDKLVDDGVINQKFNLKFFTNGDSREPELAGILGATIGSLLTMLVALALAFPLGVAAAIYLEEFAPKNRWTDLVEVNINNLAAVPSIVFGLLGLAVFLGFFGMHRSAPLVGGVVLALMTLPTVIIASRAALGSVPPSIREAATGIGASPMQVVLHHVLPLAFPGILTGTIIGAARALGETAPLLMIGMVAFIVDIPQGINDSATALPVQIFLWADSPERAFVEKTAAATLVLLTVLIIMNLGAVLLRKKFERRW